MFELSKKDQAADRGQSSEPIRAKRSARAGSGGNAVIGRSIKIIGDLRGDEDLRIEGDIDGTIQLPNNSLTIGTDGRINADVYAKSIIIEGEINGDVYGSECVTIRAQARVAGNVVAARVSVEEGAQFRGSIDMDPKSLKAALEKVHTKSTSAESGGRTNGTNSTPPAPSAADKSKSASGIRETTESVR